MQALSHAYRILRPLGALLRRRMVAGVEVKFVFFARIAGMEGATHFCGAAVADGPGCAVRGGGHAAAQDIADGGDHVRDE